MSQSGDDLVYIVGTEIVWDENTDRNQVVEVQVSVVAGDTVIRRLSLAIGGQYLGVFRAVR